MPTTPAPNPLARPVLGDADLAAVRLRHDEALADVQANGWRPTPAACSAADVPALLAEVARLKALLGGAHSLLAAQAEACRQLALDISAYPDTAHVAFRASDLAEAAHGLLRSHGVPVVSEPSPPTG